MLDGRSRGPSLALGMIDDFCHSERSRGISNYLESENRDVLTELDMRNREKLLIKSESLTNS